MAGNDSRVDLPPRRAPRPRRQGAALPLRSVDPRQMGGAPRARHARDVDADRAAGGGAGAGTSVDDDRASVPDDARAADHGFGQHDRPADRAALGRARWLVRVAAAFAVRARAERVLCRSREPRGPEAPPVDADRRQRAVHRHAAAARAADAAAGDARRGRARQAALRRFEARVRRSSRCSRDSPRRSIPSSSRFRAAAIARR